MRILYVRVTCPTVKQSCTIRVFHNIFQLLRPFINSIYFQLSDPKTRQLIQRKFMSNLVIISFEQAFSQKTFFSFVDSLNRNVLRYVWCMPKHKQARRFVLSSLHVVLPLLCVVDLIESCCCCFYLNIYFFVSLSICHIKQICRRARLSPNRHTTSLFPNSVPSGEGDPKNLPLNCVLKIVFHAFLSFVLFPRPFFGDCTRLKKKRIR